MGRKQARRRRRFPFHAAGRAKQELMSKALIVDDREAEVDLLKAYLADSVEEVRTLTDSRLIEEVFAEFQPDIILPDLHMPDPDGVEVLRRLRSAPSSLGHVPTLV